MQPSSTNHLQSTAEEIAITCLRGKIDDLLNEDCKLADDLYLLVWLKYFKFKVSKAETGIRESLKWRKENNVDELLTQGFDPEISTEFPIFLESVTKAGLPIMILKLGQLLGKFEKSRLLRHWHQALIKTEKLVMDFNRRKYTEQCVKEKRKIPITTDFILGGFKLIDCKKFSFSSNLLQKPSALQLCLSLATNCFTYFPSLGTIAYFIHMNKSFDICFKLVKPIATLTLPQLKLEVLDSNNESSWKLVLLELIDSHDLPKAYGGTKITELNY